MDAVNEVVVKENKGLKNLTEVKQRTNEKKKKESLVENESTENVT